MCPDRHRRGANLGHKLVERGLFVYLGSPSGSTFTHFFIRMDTFEHKVFVWVAPLEMPLACT
jgi:hypothetical protein